MSARGLDGGPAGLTSGSGVWARGSLALACAAVLSACGAPSEETPRTSPVDAACVPVDGSLTAGATLEGRAGAWRLELVSDDGQQRSVGALTLVAQPDSLRSMDGAVSPLFGSTTVRPTDVGAPAVGGLESVDPAAPGVLVVERDADDGRSVVLRLGSSLNRRGVTYFDAATVVLDVRRVDADGFAGDWRGEVGVRSTRGHFCAVAAGG